MATPNTFQVDRLLAGYANGYALNASNYVAPMIFPVITHSKLSGKIANIDPNNNFQRIFDTKRAQGAYPDELPFEDGATLSFEAEDHSLTGVIPAEILDNADPEFQYAIPTVQILVDAIFRRREDDFLTELSSIPGTNTASPSNKWNDNAGDMIKDVVNQFETIQKTIGVSPNTFVISSKAARAIYQAPSIQEKLVSGNFPFPDQRRENANEVNGIANTFRYLLGVDRVILADSYKNTANLGATSVMTNIWDETALLAYVPPTPRVNPSQAMGLHIVPTNVSVRVNGTAAIQTRTPGGFLVIREYDARKKCELVTVSQYYDQKSVNLTSGFRWTNILS